MESSLFEKFVDDIGVNFDIEDSTVISVLQFLRNYALSPSEAISSFIKEYYDKVREAEELRCENRKLTISHFLQKRIIQEYDDDYANLCNDYDYLDYHYEGLQCDHETLIQDKGNLEFDCIKLEEQIDDLNDKLKKKELKHKEVVHKHVGEIDFLRSVQHNYEVLNFKNKRDSLISKVCLEKQHDMLKSNYVRAFIDKENDIFAYDVQVGMLLIENVQLKKIISVHVNKLEEISSDHELKFESVRDYYKSLNDSICEDNVNLCDENELLREDNESLAETNKSLYEDYKAISKKLSFSDKSKESRFKSLKNENEGLREDHESLHNDNLSLRESLSNIKKEKERLEDEKERLEDEMTQMKKDFDSASSADMRAIKHLREMYNQVSTKYCALQETDCGLKAEIVGLRQQLEQNESDMSELLSQIPRRKKRRSRRNCVVRYSN